MIREIPMIVFVTLSTLASQLLVKNGVNVIAARAPGLKGFQWLIAAATSPSVVGAVAIQGVAFLVLVVVVSRMKLGIAFAISGAFFYIFIGLSSWLIYGEKLSFLQWGGLAMVSCGVLLMVVDSH